MNVSVIINTLNRDYWIRRVLNALARQKYDDFEIVVVNGPSTDRTEEFLQDYKELIKIEKCYVENISVSRNIGIKAASGEILIFIDDDAVPLDIHWIQHYVTAFENEHYLGCIGGKVFNGYGEVQQEADGWSIMDVWGHLHHSRDVHVKFPMTTYEYYRVSTGCNTAFRKKAVLEVGGFDEYFEFAYDESDVQVRVQRAGYKSTWHHQANVYHEGARSALRQSKYIQNWYPFFKNSVYFALKNSEGLFDLDTRKANALNAANTQKRIMYEGWYKVGHITDEEYSKITTMYEEGTQKGFRDGMEQQRKLRFDLETRSIFKKFDKAKSPKQLNVLYVCSDSLQYSHGGSATHTKELAKGLRDLGVNVHVVYICKENADYLSEGINFYSVVPSPLNIKNLIGRDACKNAIVRSYALYAKVKKLVVMFQIDIIETHLWDYAGLMCAEMLDTPVVTRLQTPLKTVRAMHNHEESNDYLLYYAFEKRLMKKSAALISISDSIKKSIIDAYEIDIEDKCEKNYLGFGEPPLAPRMATGCTFPPSPTDAANGQYEKQIDGKKIKVLFIGRLERRKGVATLFDCMPSIVRKHKNVEFKFVGMDCHDVTYGMTFIEYFKHNHSYLINHVKFLGEVSDEEKEAELASCDIFVAPSLYESFGIVFIEAMRHKKPVVACNTGAAPEIIIHGETGLLCEPNKSDDLEKSIDMLITDERKRSEIGQKGFERYTEMFTREQMCRRALQIYQKYMYQGEV